MKKHDNGSLRELIFISSYILIVLVISVFASLLVTALDKNDVRKQMNEVSQYIKMQCIRYEELNDEDTSRSIYDVSDKAFSIRNAIDYNSDDIEAKLRSYAETNRLNGIIVTETDEETSSGRIVSYYVDLNDDYNIWKTRSGSFSSVSGVLFKSFGERLKDGGYYYDYAVVSRSDGKGIVLCYKRQRIESVEDERFSIATLLKGYTFGSGGTIIVTDGQTVVAANVDGDVGIPAADCAVVRKLRQINESNELIRVKDEGIYYGSRSKCKNLFIYTFFPEAEVFTKRSVVLPYLVLIYVLALVVIVIVRRLILHKKQLEQERIYEEYRINNEKLAEQAIRANEVKTEFLRRMSHDLRTPLNGIRGMVRIGDHYADDLEKQKECRQKIWDASEYLLDLVNDVLYMNKLFVSEPEWKDEKFYLSELLSEIDNFIINLANDAGVEYVASKEKIDHDYLFGAKTQLKRVLVNLISNAVKYNKKNGSVNVYAREISVKDGMVSYNFVCADTGIGMSEEFKTRMFEPFERENNTVSEKLEGVGLGLSIVKKIVTRAGWDLTCESKKGEGTTFTLTASFKIAESPTADKSKKFVEGDKKLMGKTILIAEDNDLNYEIVDFVIGVAGACAIRAKDGEEAVNIFKTSKVGELDAILMDVMMPRVDGLAAARTIRGLDRADAKDIPIIAMSASAFDDDIRKSKEAGMNEHITKPIDNVKLIDCLVNLLAKKRG